MRLQNTLLENLTTYYLNALIEKLYLSPITTNFLKSTVPKIILDPHHPPFVSLAMWVKLKTKCCTSGRTYFQNFATWGTYDFMKDRAFLLNDMKKITLIFCDEMWKISHSQTWCYLLSSAFHTEIQYPIKKKWFIQSRLTITTVEY